MVQSQTDSPEEGDLWTARWWSKHAIPKTVEVAYSVGQLWEKIEWTSNYNITRCTGSSDELERRCWIEEHVPERLVPQAPGWAAQENGKETWLWPIEWGSICGSSIRSPTPSHTQPFQIKWEVYLSKELCRSSLLCHCYDLAWICIWVNNNNKHYQFGSEDLGVIVFVWLSFGFMTYQPRLFNAKSFLYINIKYMIS